MLTSIRGTYEDGQITLDEQPPVTRKARVIVTILDEVAKPVIQFGRMKDNFWMTDTFNDPIDDLNDYM
ncbi:DUF2281 domain-containing protein [Spirosoma agri]|uniref:DUF2281 domain-containing protein n=1 Tax=Spirosoma agri TaxID=1987381 RepID=A0A6M0IPC6_9BACT|nr:DUF2281 domain-containing protein [Spirosoma agri]NEU69787.1 DUF2281 domain-containing protein [Spirosoma agri]